MSAPEDVKLLEIAGSISNGAEIDWDRIRAHADDPASSGILRDLQAVAQIAAFHRTTDPSASSTHRDGARGLPTPLASWSHFTVLETIGHGSFGAVYRARDTKLQTEVALKLVPLPADRVVNLSRVLQEARLLARVRHANIVKVYGVDVVDRHVGLWMEFIEGRTLAALLREHGPLGAREAALIGADLCQALAAVHAAGLIHGDVKARNVMREAGGRTVLMDFGTGKDLRLHPVGPSPELDLAGTPLYLAPEVFRGEPRSALTDIYGLGVLLYHLVTNAYPVDGRTQVDIEKAHERGARTRLRDARPDLPADVVAAIEQAIAIDPAERFQTMGAFEAALAQFLGRPAVPDRAPASRMWWLAAAVIVVLSGIGVSRTVIDLFSRRGGVAAPAAADPAPAPVTAASSYQIDTAVYRRRGAAETRLRTGDRVAPGDQLFAQVRVSVPTYVYIVNEDDNGDTFLLFPLPGQAIENPIAPATPMRIPGTPGGGDVSWQITSAGGREHFLIFAARERLQAFEAMFAALPRPAFGGPITAATLPPGVAGKLRGVGGLTSQTTPPSARLATIFTAPLGDREETAQGVWVRQLTVENPR